jgi:hypothetical protein
MPLDASASRDTVPRWKALLARIGKPAAVSLILLVLVLAVWIRSYGFSTLNFQSGRFIAFAHEGQVTLRVVSAEPVGGDAQDIKGWMFLGLGAYKMTYPSGYHYSVAFPLWLLAVVLAIIPARRFRRLALERRAERRRAANQCVACGYDLRASTGSCPECGAPAVADAGGSAGA